MRLIVKSLNSPHYVQISPKDSWLRQLAKDLSPSSPEEAAISGELTLRADNAGFIHANGHITASALLPCDRCGRDVTIPLASNIQATFRPSYDGQAPREMSLSAEDLDTYFIEGGQIDLEILVNDTLQCALPGHIACPPSAENSCSSDVDEDSDEEERPSNDKTGENSPFAILKSLKKS
jgi:uncharacterized metal-binding protein YceD (DUF177 family)